MKERQSGQIVIIMLLVMVLALAVGLAIIGRSISEVSTSTKSENSSRAFSAAEAGLEKIMAPSNTGTSIPLTSQNNNSVYSANKNENPGPNRALEYVSALLRGEMAQFWLVDPDDLNCSTDCYTANSFNLYFGAPNVDYAADPNASPAMEVNVIYYSNGAYGMDRYFVDTKNPNRFDATGAKLNIYTCGSTLGTVLGPDAIDTNINTRTKFYCMAPIPLTTSNRTNIMVRVKSLYSEKNHKVAIQPVSDSLPAQGYIFESTGKAGTSLRKIMVQRQKDIMPRYFDYVLYSDSGLNK